MWRWGYLGKSCGSGGTWVQSLYPGGGIWVQSCGCGGIWVRVVDVGVSGYRVCGGRGTPGSTESVEVGVPLPPQSLYLGGGIWVQSLYPGGGIWVQSLWRWGTPRSTESVPRYPHLGTESVPRWGYLGKSYLGGGI